SVAQGARELRRRALGGLGRSPARPHPRLTPPDQTSENGWERRTAALKSGSTMETAMLAPDRIADTTMPMPLAGAEADYAVVRRAIGHIRQNWRAQPEIDEIAEAAGVTPTELHHLFRRWAGLTPKAFLQAL